MPTNSTIITSAIESFEDQVLAALKTAQDYYVGGVKAWAESVGNVIPKLPAPSLLDQSQLAEVLDSGFKFTASVIEAQRESTSKLLAATAPLFAGQATSSKSQPSRSGGAEKA
jgi:hypothetical protein